MVVKYSVYVVNMFNNITKSMILREKQFERVIRRPSSKKDRQVNGQKKQDKATLHINLRTEPHEPH
jgi:hypothetical protein